MLFDIIPVRTYCSFCDMHSCVMIPSKILPVVKCTKCDAHYDGLSQAVEEQFYEANKYESHGS